MMFRIFLTAFGLVILLSGNLSFAQSGVGEAGSQNTEPSTETQELIEIKQPVFRWFYWPDEEPQNFDLSTMGHGNSGTTIGEKTSRKSNLEVNTMGNRQEDNQDNNSEGPKSDESDPNMDTDSQFEEPDTVKSSRKPSSNPLIKWVDEDGNIHITNKPGNVPQDKQ